MMVIQGAANGSRSQGGQQPAAASGTYIVPSGQTFILQLETDLHTNTTRKGDKVKFSTAAEVVADSQTVIPSRSLVWGTVTESKRAGRLAGRAEIRLRLDEIRLADGTMVPFHATIVRVGYDPVKPAGAGDPGVKGESGAGADAGTIVKAGAQGAIIGVITAGPRGAMIGSIAGIAVTAAGMIFRRGPDVDLPRDTMMEAKFDQPLTIPESAVATAKAQAQPQLQDMPAEPQTAVPAAEKTSPPRPKLTRNDQSAPPPVGNPPATRPTEDPPVAKPSENPPAVKPAEGSPVATPVPSNAGTPRSAGAHTLSVDVRMVLVDAVVKDRGGRILENLQKEDFQVFEDGKTKELQSFSRDELPLAIALVVDCSGSEAPYIQELRRVAERALQELKPEDQVALFSFAADVRLVEELTTDRKRISDGLNRIRAQGGTNIIDALYEAAGYLKAEARDRRRAIILISDNQVSMNSRSSEAATIKVALESETVIYSIKTKGMALPLASQLPSVLGGSGPVGKITEETGGEIINAANTSSFGSALSGVISRLRLRYSLGYYLASGAQGAFHSIEVRLDDRFGRAGKDYVIHARRGYYATSDRIR